MYLTYDEFTETYGGTLDETTFDDLEFEAECYVDEYTFNRLHGETEIPERVKRCMAHIIKMLKSQMDLMNTPAVDGQTDSSGAVAGIASQSNDGVSISYNVISASDALTLSKQEVDKTIKRYLQGVSNSLGRKLLYRGIYPDE